VSVTGNIFERRLIEAYISENGSDPVTGEQITVDDLLDLQSARIVKARPPQLTSIPALLSTFQNEWDAIVLESFQLKQQLQETRQELSTALYYNDSANRVIARLKGERDEARDALARVQVTGSAANGVNGGSNGDAMQVDGQGLPEEVVAKIEDTQARLQGTRRKRPVPEDWATGDQIAGYAVKSTEDSQFTGARKLAVDETGDFFLCGDSDGDIGVYDLKSGAFTTRSNVGAGGITGGAFANDRAVVSTSSGAVVVTQGGSVVTKFHQHAGAANAVAAHPCGELLASVGSDKSYVLYDLQTAKVLTQIYTDSGMLRHPKDHFDPKTDYLQNSQPSPSTQTATSSPPAHQQEPSSSSTSSRHRHCTLSRHPHQTRKHPSPHLHSRRTARGSRLPTPNLLPSRSGICGRRTCSRLSMWVRQ